MKFELFGTSPGLPESGKNLSSLICKLNNTIIITDCGEGVAKSYLKKGYNQDDLDIIIITHYHPDHISGFYMLIQTLYLKKRVKSLKVFLPERINDFIETMRLFYTFPKKLSFSIEFFLVKDIHEHYFFLEATENDHLTTYKKFVTEQDYANTMQSFSIKYHDRDKSLVYTSDLQTIESILEFLKDSDLCILDAIHPDFSCFLIIDKIIKKKILLTHGDQPNLKDLVKGNHKFEYAEENKIYCL